jgi:hypothetical protein
MLCAQQLLLQDCKTPAALLDFQELYDASLPCLLLPPLAAAVTPPLLLLWLLLLLLLH